MQIVLTDDGRALWQQLKQRGEDAIADALRDLSAEEREHLFSLLARVRDSLNSP